MLYGFKNCNNMENDKLRKILAMGRGSTIRYTGILLVSLCMFAVFAYAQDEGIGIRGTIIGKGKPYQDRISLRWNISNYQVFRQLTVDGVLIDRIILDKDNNPESADWVRISNDTIRAIPLEEFDTPDFGTDTARMVVAQGLYGKSEFPLGVPFIEQLKMQDEDRQNRHLMVSLYAAVSPGAALSAGLAFEDGIIPDTAKKYVYRICPVRPIGESGRIDTGFIYVVGHDLLATERYRGLRTEAGEQHIVLQWPKENSPFTGYYIERSLDKENFRRVNEHIYLPDSDPDTTRASKFYHYYDSVANYTTYHYRLVGVNAFGEHIAFADTASGMAVDFTPPAAPNLTMLKEEREVTLTWNKGTDGDLAGYYLLKGKTVSASDSLLVNEMLPPDRTEYRFTLPGDFNSAYYRLMVADTSGNMNYSNAVYVFLPDTVPPSAPVGLSGIIDTMGIVTLHWPLDSTNKALRGYKVYTANQADHQFIPITDIVPDTTYAFDAGLKTLSKHLYIKIAAIDASFNHSDLSDAIIITRPDTIPPPHPVILDYHTGREGVSITWSEVLSEDLSHYLLFRKETGQSNWQKLLETKETKYTDSTVLSRKSYEYALRAVDSAGLYSGYSFPLHVRTGSYTVNKPISIKVEYDAEQKQVHLTWTKPEAEVSFFVIYKDNGNGLVMHDSVSATQYMFSESAAHPADGSYGLKIVYADKSESEILIFR